MKPVLTALALALALPALPAAAAGPGHCPPGLAKKSPACIPPGQAKKWGIGDRYDGPWDRAEWWRYDLPRPRTDERWVRVGDVMLRVDEDTRRILDLIRLADLVLGG